MSVPEVTGGAVVVGHDGSPAAETSVAWAAEEAVRRGVGLHLLHCPPLTGAAAWWGVPLTPGILEEGRDVLEDAARRAQRRHPRLRVTIETVVAEPAVALVEASQHAGLVVVGARGLGRVTGPLLGSVSQKVSAHAHGPVVVVREPSPAPGGPVLVGMDPRDGAPLAMGYALSDARRRGVPVLAVLGLQEAALRVGHADEEVAARMGEVAALAQREALERAARWRERFPEVVLDLELTADHPIDALVERSASASLVVVGSRGRGGLAGMLLGSVSRGVLHGAPVVAVVREHGGVSREWA